MAYMKDDRPGIDDSNRKPKKRKKVAYNRESGERIKTAAKKKKKEKTWGQKMMNKWQKKFNPTDKKVAKALKEANA